MPQKTARRPIPPASASTRSEADAPTTDSSSRSGRRGGPPRLWGPVGSTRARTAAADPSPAGDAAHASASSARPRRGTSPDGDGRGRPSTRERILDIALDLFVERGYDKTSLREIAERLGFTKAAIYYHFASKDDILLALHLRMHDLGRASIQALAEDRSPLSWAASLRALVDVMLANRKLLLFHERNRAALETLHSHEHDAANEDIEAVFLKTLRDPALAPRDRIRLVTALGALMGSLIFLGDIDEAELPTYGGLLREVITDLLGA